MDVIKNLNVLNSRKKNKPFIKTNKYKTMFRYECFYYNNYIFYFIFNMLSYFKNILRKKCF